MSPTASDQGLRRVNPGGLYRIDPLQDRRWQDLVLAHPASSIFHRTEWLHALRSAYGYEPVVYTKCGPSAALTSGVVFCQVKSWLTGRRLVSLPFSDHCEPLLESAAELDDLLSALKEDVAGEGWKYCEIRPLRAEPGASTSFTRSQRYLRHAVDLRPNMEGIFQNLHASVRRKIRRAQREALSYEEGNSEDLLERFYRLAVMTRRRHRLPPQPLRWFRSLIKYLGADLRIQVASKNGAAVASILTVSHGKTVTYKYGCSDARMHSLGGVALLLWNTIQQAKAAGYESLDLGRSDIDNEGLASFKENWGGMRSDISYWRYPHRPRQDSRHNAVNQRILGRLVQAAPDRMLVAAGNLLYRHIG